MLPVGLSIWHILILVVWLSPVIAMANILRRVGYSPWLALLFLLPVANLLLFLAFAYARWPVDRER